ncbi:LPS-assembly protein LptD @ Organic solvent tolerance protein precursor [hydrothermal vent metagenome]|uniref:LPS-assembly protein LptD @ Organic solvent tolerance protein n=1 Tax=hydrothermal vent metagenome TaxID=652676 RepID=A0A3B0UCH9_9ZZZZ
MYKTTLTYIFFLFAGIVFGQEPLTSQSRADTLPGIIGNPFLVPIDTQATSMNLPKRDTSRRMAIDEPVKYSAEDSMIISAGGEKAYLYNNAKVTFKDIELSAYYIELDLKTKEVYAEGFTDTSGVVIGAPVFKDGGEEFESKTLRYNFISQKGIITDVKSAQGEGYIHSAWTKKISPDEYILRDGKYTTCDASHPHFYLHLTKAKVIQNKKIVTGPAYMVLEDLPLYFAIIPFGYFPSTPTYSSGIIMPTYGEEQNRGFFLRDGGYYWAAGQYFDLAVTGDIYSKGSWATSVQSKYKLKYHFSGSFGIDYTVNAYGDKALGTFNKTPQLRISWSHSQDAKANPNRTFSASVNFSTSGYDKQNALSAQNYLTTQKSSSISYSKKWENLPFSMTANLRHSQNSRDSTLTLSLPEMTFSMTKIYPFKRKNRVGKVKWYEKFGVSYTANMRNTITAREDEILKKSLTKDWKNGIKHNTSISLPNFNLMKYINFSPSFSYNEIWYFRTQKKTYDANNIYYDRFNKPTHVRTDTISGLKRNFQYGYSLSASTNIYGNFVPLNPNSRIKGIRHKMTPSLSFNYRPDFGNPNFGFWKQVQADSTGRTEYYDIFEGGIYGGAPSRGASGSISLSVSNNLEMKVQDTKSDSTDTKEKFRKVKLLDNLSFGTSYNLVADSFNLSVINIRGRTTVKGVNVNFGSILDPYMISPEDSVTLIDEYAWNHKKGLAKLGRITRANLSFGMSFKSKKGGKKEGKGVGREVGEEDTPPDEGPEEAPLPGSTPSYSEFDIPWDFRFDYTFGYTRRTPYEKPRITQTLSLSGSAKITQKWSIQMNTNYDIAAGEFSFTTFNVSRNLHCWRMVFNFVPFGFRKSYSFTLSANSAMLKDLKIMKNKSNYDYNYNY